MKKFAAVALGALIFAGIVPAAFAAETAAPFRVTATVIANCRIEIQPLEFEPYDPLLAHAATDLPGQTEMQLLCTKHVPATIELDAGSFGTGTRARALALGGERLRYGLFMDSARNRVWGIGSDAVVLNGFEPRATGDSIRLMIYGSIPQGQEVVAGDYSDIVTARVSF